MSYPIHITNIYELLGEEGEPVKQVNAPTKSTAAPKTAPTKGTTGKPTTTQSTSKPQAPKGDSVRKNNESRGNRDQQRPPRNTAPRNQSAETPSDFEVQNSSRNANRGEGRGERRGGRGTPSGGFVGNRRVFDRKSGTGRGREQKKGGSGRGNWGKEGEEQIIAEDVAEEGKEETVPVVEEKKEETEEEKKEREEREKEEKTLTLSDYLKQREGKGPIVALPPARKPNEGVNESEAKKWGTYVALKRDDGEEVTSSTEGKSKKEKNTVPLDQVFAVKEQPRVQRDDRDRGDRGDRRGGSRGGRGGSRGGNRGGRGGSRGGSRGESAPAFDESSFPTLNTKA